jgi:hypothetical protein
MAEVQPDEAVVNPRDMPSVAVSRNAEHGLIMGEGDVGDIARRIVDPGQPSAMIVAVERRDAGRRCDVRAPRPDQAIIPYDRSTDRSPNASSVLSAPP